MSRKPLLEELGQAGEHQPASADRVTRAACRAYLVKTWACRLTGFLMLAYGVTGLALDNNGLGRVSLIDGTVSPTTAPSTRWVTTLLCIAAGMALLNLARRAMRCNLGISLVAAALLVWALFLAQFLNDAATALPENRCLHAGCAPAHMQSALTLSPLILGLVVFTVEALLPCKAAVRRRIGWAPLVFVLADLSQLAAWDTHITPWLQQHS